MTVPSRAASRLEKELADIDEKYNRRLEEMRTWVTELDEKCESLGAATVTLATLRTFGEAMSQQFRQLLAQKETALAERCVALASGITANGLKLERLPQHFVTHRIAQEARNNIMAELRAEMRDEIQRALEGTMSGTEDRRPGINDLPEQTPGPAHAPVSPPPTPADHGGDGAGPEPSTVESRLSAIEADLARLNGNHLHHHPYARLSLCDFPEDRGLMYYLDALGSADTGLRLREHAVRQATTRFFRRWAEDPANRRHIRHTLKRGKACYALTPDGLAQFAGDVRKAS
jgi:hypothetical protein